MQKRVQDFGATLGPPHDGRARLDGLAFLLRSRDARGRRVPQERICTGRPLTKIEDIVLLVKFLVTDGWWITGQTIVARGRNTTRYSVNQDRDPSQPSMRCFRR